MTIHTFGDSHSNFGWPPGIAKHWLGPILCYSFGKDPFGRCDLRKYPLKDNDTLIFCFGEIDCRCHIIKHCTEEISYEEIIKDLVENYLKAIQTVVSSTNKKFRHICVFNVVPPIRKALRRQNPQFPFLGSDEERLAYVRYFNSCVKGKCEEMGFLFLDVYEKYSDEEGFLNTKYSDGDVHIRDGVYLKELVNMLGQ